MYKMRFLVVFALLGAALSAPLPDRRFSVNNARATFLSVDSGESSFGALSNNFIPESYGQTGGTQGVSTQIAQTGPIGGIQGVFAQAAGPQVGYGSLGGGQTTFGQVGGTQGVFAQGGGGLQGGFGQVVGGQGGVGGGNPLVYGPCPAGQGRDALGNCVDAILSQNVFVFKSPPLEVEYLPPPVIPQPKINHNIVYVHAPEAPPQPEPIIVGPDVTETKIYVLSKVPDLERQIIEVPSQPLTQPDVFYLNYREGEDHFLPGNIRLSEIINQASEEGLVYGTDDLGGQSAGYAGIAQS